MRNRDPGMLPVCERPEWHKWRKCPGRGARIFPAGDDVVFVLSGLQMGVVSVFWDNGI